MIRVAPTILSLINLLSGVAAAVCFALGLPTVSLLLIIIAAVFDVLDGWLARRVGSTGRGGVWMDTVADMVSFGLAPAAMIVLLLPLPFAAWLLAGTYSAAMGFRLVRFSQTVERRDRWFLGMPSPAAAIAVVAACTVVVASPESWLLVAAAVFVFATLAVSRLPYPKGTHPSLNRLPRLLTLLIWAVHAVLFFLLPGLAALSLMVVYAVLGPVLLRAHFRDQG